MQSNSASTRMGIRITEELADMMGFDVAGEGHTARF
jgi:hypothetical protein